MATLLSLLLLHFLLLLTLLSSLLLYHFTLKYLFFFSPINTSSNYHNSCYGPKSHPIIGSFIPFYKNRHRLLDWYTDLLSSSPTHTITIRRLGSRPTIITANPDNVEHILKTNFPNYPKGKPFTDMLSDLLGSGIFNADGHLWLNQRKLASHQFTTNSLRHLLIATLHSEFTTRLLPVLSSACLRRRPVDLQDLLRRFAFDIICRISLGTDPGFLDPSLPDSTLAAAFDIASAISARRGSAPISALWKLKRAMGIGSEKQLRDSVKLIHKSVMEIIRRRKKEKKLEGVLGHDDLLSRMISDGHGDEAIRDMVISFLMAGRDTTSAALTWFFWLISCHPDIEAELVEEVRENIMKLDYDGLKEMKLLEACLCESMRLYPPVVWDSKHAEREDELPDGTRVGRGDRVTYFPYGMGRMEGNWGQDWMEFRPGRWAAEKASPFKFAVFQAGPRVCLGREMAFVQMKYVAAAVLARFELKRVGREAPVVVPLMTAHMAGGLMVVVGERKGMDEYSAGSPS